MLSFMEHEVLLYFLKLLWNFIIFLKTGKLEVELVDYLDICWFNIVF